MQGLVVCWGSCVFANHEPLGLRGTDTLSSLLVLHICASGVYSGPPLAPEIAKAPLLLLLQRQWSFKACERV